MPRLTVAVPKYCLHRASGQAIVALDGKDFYLGPYNTPESRARYDRLVGEWQSNGRRIVARGPEQLTVDEVLLAYFRHAERYYVKNGQPTSTIHQIKVIMALLHSLYGRTTAAEFGPLSLKSLQQEMVRQGTWCRRTINKHIGSVKGIFKWAASEELLPSGVYHGLQTVAGLRRGRTEARESKPVGPVPQSHIDAMLPLVSKPVAAMIRLQHLTGMRSGELVIMRGCDINTYGKVWTYRPASHKTEHHGYERDVYLGPRAQIVLRPFLGRDPQAYLFDPAEAEEDRNTEKRRNRQTPMTPSQAARRRKPFRKRMPGDRYTPNSYCRAIARACEKAEIPNWHPHQLRHNAGTLVRREYGIEAARVILGHHSPAVTEVYAEIDRMKAVEVMARVG